MADNGETPSRLNDPVQAADAAPRVVLERSAVHVRELWADGAIVEVVRQAVKAGRDPEATVKQALDVGAAVLLQGAAKGTVDAVAAEVDRILEALRARTSALEVARRTRDQISARGFSFEDELGEALEALFAPHSDILERTGAVKGIAEDKCGDFVATVNLRDTGGHDRRVVFEAKDRKLALRGALEELDEAMLNRGAQVGVMVFARSSQAPLAGKRLRAFPGRRLIVVWDRDNDGDLPLEVAVQLARTLACCVETDEGRLNRRGIATRLEQLINVVEGAEEIARGIKGARRSLDSAQSAYDKMREGALALLLELQDRL